jgi:hypothetical protein
MWDMTVFVDDMKARVVMGKRIFCFSHMVADTLDELHDMADKIGVQRRWFQRNASHPHYDIVQSKKALAVSFGAKEITQRQLAMMCAHARRTGSLGTPDTAEKIWRDNRQSKGLKVHG